MICDKKLLFFKSHEDRGMKGTIEVVRSRISIHGLSLHGNNAISSD